MSARHLTNLEAVATACELVAESVHFYGTHKDALGRDIRATLAEVDGLRKERDAAVAEARRLRAFVGAGKN